MARRNRNGSIRVQRDAHLAAKEKADAAKVAAEQAQQDALAAAQAAIAKAAEHPNDDTLSAARKAFYNALDAMPADTRSPSQKLATTHAVDQIARSPKEQRAAQYAMDFNGTSRDALTFVESTGFPGFPTLSLLAQLPEYRAMHERLADEVVRMFGKARSTGNAPPARLSQIDAEVERLNIREAIRTLVIHDQANGGAHAYMRMQGDDGFKDTPLVAKPYTVRPGTFLGIQPIEAYWVSPNNYNSIDPTKPDFYKPSTWWAIGTEMHASRLRTIISRPVADMLKPAYSFRGVSMSQLAMPYIDNWLRTRQSVSDTVKQYSVSGVKTDLAQSLAPGANQDLAMRAELINRYRDNRNILFLDMATEEFFQFSTPLSGLDALQAQAQEQQSAVCHIPLVILLGITPTGLNASSEGEIRAFYDYVRGYQQNVLSSFMNDVLEFVQLSLDGKLDPSIKWEWQPLMELTALELAEKNNKDAATDQIYLQEQVISPAQVAERLNADANSLYSGLLSNTSDMSDLADNDIGGITDRIIDAGANPAENQPSPKMGGLEPAVPQQVAEPTDNPEEAGTPDEQQAHDMALDSYSLDAEWSENEHPRAENGQFGAGGSKSGASKKAKLTPNERSALSSYSGDNFLRINRELREGNTSDPEVGRIDSAIGKSVLPSGTTLYRGMSREAAKKLFPDGNIVRGATVSDPAFASTSQSAHIAGQIGFGGVILKIETGSNATGIDMSKHSRNENEKEVLLPRNAKMKVVGLTPPKTPGGAVIVRVQYGDHDV